MAKRLGEFNLNPNNKKSKVDDNLDDLWGDDLDADDIDDCFKLATQICEEDKIVCTQRNNVSIFPSYNAFKQTKRVFTSTQSNPELNSSINLPSTSKNGVTAVPVINPFSVKNGEAFKNGLKENEKLSNLESRVQKLQEQYLAKEGEVSILRSQLKETKVNHENEQKKKQKEWSDRLATATKELGAVRSELEFKNLEIANLKQRVHEVAKLNHLDVTFNASQSALPKKLKTCESRPNNKAANTTADGTDLDYKKIELKLCATAETTYPLQHIIPSSIFNPTKGEKYLVDIKNKRMCRNTIPFLQNQMSQDLTNKLVKLQPKITMLDNGRWLGFDYIHSDIAKLIKCNSYEIDTEENYDHINKIICVSEELLHNLYKFLRELEQNTKIENKSKIDVIYLENKLEDMDLNLSPFKGEQWCNNEMGIGARQSIMCISAILPYSSYLKEYLLQNKHLIFKGDEEYLKYLSSVSMKSDVEYYNNFDYLNLLMKIVTIIKRLKNSFNFPGLLSAVAVLLDKIATCFEIDSIHNIINNLTQEIIFCSPNLQVLFNITSFLKSASLQNVFVNNLCKIPLKNSLQIKHKERVLYYNQDTSCVLQVLCILLEDYISKARDVDILNMYLNIIKFISNCIECNPRWLFYQEDKHCDCLCKIVKLYVDVIYQTVKRFHAKNDAMAPDERPDYLEILKSGIKILHFQNFKVSDLIVKYVTTYSQYRLIVKLLSLSKSLNLSEQDVEILEYLNVTEDIQQIEKFEDIPLWN